eukprot:TRINITY_DN4002_c0_g1_i1.p1 TRINITY_DN4002_c0_g1~~TRINITY_DN4002_c0_g1_i1.p1  ORF type:complete len:502 (-),score=71.55 TRINITY_DN4002_c0_g1_i1:27-1532(-)
MAGLVTLLALSISSCTVSVGVAIALDDISGTSAARRSVFSYFSQSFYHKSLLPLLLITLALAWFTRPSTRETISPSFRHFQINYLVAWFLCVGADWLQGPYVYALYASYGYNTHEIAQLFVAGFVSSMIFGCFVGSFADTFGRKKTCLAYCLFYILSCLTKHVNIYWILMFGRITGGIATSILFSGFECWMVSEHTLRHGFSGDLLSYMFGLMFTIMYLVAILAGFVSQLVVDSAMFRPISVGSNFYIGGPLGPFDLSIVLLVFGMIWIMTRWRENDGKSLTVGGVVDTRSGVGIAGMLLNAGRSLLLDYRVCLMCVVVSCFEGAMYAFVFNWTPALESKEVPPPYGLIFSAFMMACMCGTSVSSILSNSITPTVRLALTCMLGVIAFIVSAWTSGSSKLVNFVCFLVFEFCVGVYFPASGVVKSDLVPENVRTTIYNLYRVPLNAVVVGLLLTDISVVRCFELCSLLLATSGLAIAVISCTKKKDVFHNPSSDWKGNAFA